MGNIQFDKTVKEWMNGKDVSSEEWEAALEEDQERDQDKLRALTDLELAEKLYDTLFKDGGDCLDESTIYAVQDMALMMVERLKGICQHEYEWNDSCGAKVCVKCYEHKGLSRCYCGWGLAPGERLEDDDGEY